MKRTVLHQANSVDFPAPDSKKGVDVSKQVTSGTSKACTSAAVIGLAISMGASSLLMTREGDRVMASEAFPQSHSTGEKQLEPSSLDLGSVPTPSASNPAAISPIQTTKALKGQVVWDLSQKTEVDDSLIAKAKTLESVSQDSVSPSSQVSPPAESGVKSRSVHGETDLSISQSSLKDRVVPPTSSSVPGQSSATLPVIPLVPAESTETGNSQLTQSHTLTPTQGEKSSESLSPSFRGTLPEIPKSELSSLSGLSELSSPTVITSPRISRSSQRVYQIQPGDTLNGIARQYGVSVSELMTLNNITDPNVLFVYESLKIPETGSNPVNPGVDSATTEANLSTNQGGLSQDAINLTPNLRPLSVSPEKPVSLETVETQAMVSETTRPQTPTVVTAPTPVNVWTAKEIGTQTPVTAVKESAIRPYENRLQSDLSRLRAEYEKTRQASETEKGTPDVQTQTPRQVNPEFQAEYAQATTRNEKTPHQARHWVEQVQRLRTEQLSSVEESAAPLSRSSDNRALVATAPIGAAGYDPLRNPVLERMVSPELPPLPGAERFLPGGSPRSKRFIWPSKGELTSGYGWRWGRMHRGIDIAAPIGTPIVAVDDGVVTYAAWNDGGYGYLVEITHSNGSMTLYAHNNRILVREGQQVTQGQQISEMGSTGFSTGPHLHFEIHPTGKGAVDPMAFLPSANSVASGQ